MRRNMASNSRLQEEGCIFFIMYEIFFVNNFVSGLRTSKPKNPKPQKTLKPITTYKPKK